jgi:hypothetical protein
VIIKNFLPGFTAEKELLRPRLSSPEDDGNDDNVKE